MQQSRSDPLALTTIHLNSHSTPLTPLRSTPTLRTLAQLIWPARDSGSSTMITDAVGVVPASPSGTGAGPVSQLGSHLPLSRDGSMVELSRENSLSDTCNTSAASRREAARRQAAAEAALLKKAVGGGKTITFVSGVAFLINNVTGGGMVLFPGVMQQAGWAVVVIALLAVMLLASVCGFMLIEAMAMVSRAHNRCTHRAHETLGGAHWQSFDCV